MSSRRYRYINRAVRVLVHFVEAVQFYARTIARQMFEDDILLLASGLAFNGILTMIPLMLLTASAIGTFLNSSVLGVQHLNEILDAIFPPQPFAISIKQSILSIVSDIVTYRTSLGIFGFLVLFWTATFLFDALRAALHRIYHLKRTRGLLVSFFHDVGFVFLALILFLTSNFAIWVYSLLKQLARSIPALHSAAVPSFDRAVPTVIVVLLTACMFYIIYGHMTDTKPPRAAAIISTITTTLLWVVSGKIFGVYLADFSVIGKIYGPYAFLLVLLFWIYYSCIIFVFGGIAGQAYWERTKSMEAGKPVDTPRSL